MSYLLLVAITIPVIVVLFGFAQFFVLRESQETYRKVFLTLDEPLDRWHSFIPEVVDLMHGFFPQKRKLLDGLLRSSVAVEYARKQAMVFQEPAMIETLITAEESVWILLNRVFDYGSQFDRVRTDERVLAMREELEKRFQHLEVARRRYNDSVMRFNALRGGGLTSIVADVAHFHSAVAYRIKRD